MAVLETKGATMRFGGLTAVDSLSLRVDNREIVAVIGPNGAGKTTAFNMITGVYRPTEGEIFFSDTCISRKRPDQIARLGVARTFQNIICTCGAACLARLSAPLWPEGRRHRWQSAP